MGSGSDLGTMRHAAETLESLGIEYEMRIISAHRRPDATMAFARGARGRGMRVIIAGAGGAAHLPGVLSACTTLPVLGVPVHGPSLSGADSLYSIVQMPRGIPVGTLAIGRSGAVNAALLAAAILALDDADLAERLERHRENLETQVTGDDERLASTLEARAKDGGSLADALAAAGFPT